MLKFEISTSFDEALAHKRAAARPARQAGEAAHPGRRNKAYEAVVAALEAQARIAVLYLIKDRARAYMLHPTSLDAIDKNLSFLSPRGMLARLEDLRIEASPLRANGLCPDVVRVNHAAARLYARCLRRIDSRMAHIGGAE